MKLRSSLLFFSVPMLSFLTGCLSYHRGPMPGEPQATYTHVDGVRLRYLDSAEKHPEDLQKPTVVLVHGFASSLENWIGVIPQLQPTHRILAYDLKGFGWSERPEGDYSNLAQARLLLGLMQQRGIEHASLVGHSWGTSVVLSAVVHAPSKVDRFVLISPYAYNAQIPTFFHWAQAPGVGETLFSAFYKSAHDERIGMGFYDKKWVTQDLVDAVERAMDRPGTVAAALASARGQNFGSLEGRYRTVEQQALVMVGRDDTVATPHFARKLARDLKNARYVEYDECAHFPMIENQSQTNRDLLAFLDPKAIQDAANGAPRPAPAPGAVEPPATPNGTMPATPSQDKDTP